MKDKAVSKNKIPVIMSFPLLFGIILLIIADQTSNGIFLDEGFNVRFEILISLVLSHLVLIIALIKLNKVNIKVKTPIKKILLFIGCLIFIFSSCLLLGMGLQYNFNYWFRSNNTQKINLMVAEKKVSHNSKGGNDYYIIFSSDCGKLKNKVRRKKFESFLVGEKYEALVNKGFFDGYFLTKPMVKNE